MPETAVILLAAGNSERMGEPKQLLDFQGKPLLRHTAETALEARCGRVVVVLGARAELLRSVLDGLDVDVVVNDRWREGMGTSIRAGMTAVSDPGLAGVILALADQPLVTPGKLRTLVCKHYQTGRAVVASWYEQTAGVPAFFAREVFSALLALPPDQGCKGIILKSGPVLVDCPEAAVDVDTPTDYERALSLGHWIE